MHINTNIDIRIKDRRTSVILFALLFAVIICFVGYQLFAVRGKKANVKTDTAVFRTVYRDISAEAFVVRNEEYVNNLYVGTVVPAVANGSKVSIGDTVAKVFASESNAKTDGRLDAVKEDIDYYNSVSNAMAGTMPADINHYKTKVFSSVIKLSSSIDSNDLASVAHLSGDFREALTKKQIACGSTVNVSDKLAGLTAEYNTLLSAASAYSAVPAERSGYYINSVDGYENSADFSEVRKIGYAAVENLLASEPSPTPANAVGKLVTEFNWYLVCNVSAKDAAELSVDDSLYVSFPNANAADMRMVLVALNEGEKEGYVTLVFKSNKMDAAIATLRKCPVKIRVEERKGYIIDPKAVRTVDGETGVFVYLGNIAVFRKINIVYSDDNMLLARSPEGESGYLKQYDEIIMEGTDLYDGKIIS